MKKRNADVEQQQSSTLNLIIYRTRLSWTSRMFPGGSWNSVEYFSGTEYWTALFDQLRRTRFSRLEEPRLLSEGVCIWDLLAVIVDHVMDCMSADNSMLHRLSHGIIGSALNIARSWAGSCKYALAQYFLSCRCSNPNYLPPITLLTYSDPADNIPLSLKST